MAESAGQAIEALQEALAWEMGDQPVGVETPSPGERLLHWSGLSEEPGWDDLAWPVVDAVFQEAAGWGS